MRVINWSNNQEHYISFNDPTYSVYPSVNLEFDTDLFRFSYSSLTTPNSVYDYNLVSKERKLLKQQEFWVVHLIQKIISQRDYMLMGRDGITRI